MHALKSCLALTILTRKTTGAYPQAIILSGILIFNATQMFQNYWSRIAMFNITLLYLFASMVRNNISRNFTSRHARHSYTHRIWVLSPNRKYTWLFISLNYLPLLMMALPCLKSLAETAQRRIGSGAIIYSKELPTAQVSNCVQGRDYEWTWVTTSHLTDGREKLAGRTSNCDSG